MWESYENLLIALQNHRWPEPVCHCFELPVHAFGYNWCASNFLSGKALKEEIDRLIGYYRRGPEGQVGGPYPRMCNHVILVTHSMGGWWLVLPVCCMALRRRCLEWSMVYSRLPARLQAELFHESLGLSFHPNTYQFYGTDLDSPDNITFSRKPCVYHHPHVHYEPPFFNKGSYATYVDDNDQMLTDSEGAAHVVMMGMPGGKGDGTVPTSSGNALMLDAERTAMIGSDHAAWFSIGHQEICTTTIAQKFIFKSITSILQELIERNCKYNLSEKKP